jgi:transposase-like protein
VTRDLSRGEMVALVRQWEQGTETRAAFAQRHGVTLATFDYWKRRVRREASTAAAAAFAPVHLVSEPRSEVDGGIDVVLASGERLTVRAGASVDLLRTILVALRTC